MAKNTTQIQVRIDMKTKKEAKKILEDLGMDISTAVKILLKNVVRTHSFPIGMQDVNGFSPEKAQELREASKEAKESKKSFSSVKELMKDLDS